MFIKGESSIKDNTQPFDGINKIYMDTFEYQAWGRVFFFQHLVKIIPLVLAAEKSRPLSLVHT